MTLAHDYFKYDALKITPKPITDTKLRYVHEFHVQYRNPETDEVYSGDFVCRRLNHAHMLQYGALKSSMLGGVASVDAHVDNMASQMAYLSVALTTTPEWWNLEVSYDAQLTRAMYEYVRFWELSFRAKRVEQRLPSAEDGSAKTE